MSAFCSGLCKSISSCCYDFYHAPFTKKNLLIGGGVLLGLIILIVIIVCAAGGSSRAPTTGADVIKSYPLVDGANSLSKNLKNLYVDKISNVPLNTNLSEYWKGASCLTCQTDLFRLRKGLVGTQVFSINTSCDSQYKDAVAQSLEQIDLMKRLIADPDNKMTLVKQSQDIAKAFSNKKTGTIISLWGGHNIDSRLAVLRMYYDLGVRIVALAGYNNTINKPCYPPWIDENTGLEEFGKKIIAEMNRLGMMIDLTGCSDAVIKSVTNSTTSPVIFSHSALATISSPFNVKEDTLTSLNKTLIGLVMVPFSPGQVCANDTNCSHTDVADKLNALLKTLSIHKVGIGSNFDNMETTPKGLEDVSKFPTLFDFLMSGSGGKHKWSSQELRKLASENFINVFKAVEQRAVTLNKINKSKADESIATKDEFDGGNGACYTDLRTRFNPSPPKTPTTTTPTTAAPTTTASTKKASKQR